MSKVVVTGDAAGNVIVVSKNNPEYGYVKLEQNLVMINNKGWLRMSKRTALIKGKVNDLMQANFTAGQILPGRIVVIESLLPTDKNNPERDLKIAGDTGVVCRLDDQPIYRSTVYTDNDDARDELITHTNSEEIKEMMDTQKAIRTLADNSLEPEF